MFYQIEMPGVTAFRHLRGVIPSFMKEPDGAACQPGLRKAEKLLQRRQCPRGDDLRLAYSGNAILDTGDMNPCGRAHSGEDGSQERRLLVVALDEIDRGAGTLLEQDRDDHARKSASRAQIQPPQGSRHQGRELRAVEDMALLEVAERRRSGQIDPLVPAPELRLELLEIAQCFT